MQSTLIDAIKNTPRGNTAASVLQKCVHCGFCNATCPTYQILGDELDGPRGRIYLMKQYLEGESDAEAIFPHIDRCLTCRSCETTCPSGVTYSELLDVTRQQFEVDQVQPRRRLFRHLLIRVMLSRRVFGATIGLGRLVRSILPASLKKLVPRAPVVGKLPSRGHPDKVLLLTGCVQPVLNANIDTATIRVLDQLGIQTLTVKDAGCCGAMHLHFGSHVQGLMQVRRNIDRWWPLVENGVRAIVNNASGCGITVRDYARLLAHDADYADKAKKISGLFRDISEIVAEASPESLDALRDNIRPQTLAFHPPCTLHHGLGLTGKISELLNSLGITVKLPANAHLCCGSAGMYSITQPGLATELRDRKLAAIDELNEDQIVSANIGCQMHLQSGTDKPVMHWVEWLDKQLTIPD